MIIVVGNMKCFWR